MEWETFVAESPDGTVFHTWGWKRFLQCHGFQPFYVVLRNGRGSLVAVCPFFLDNLFGGALRTLESLPNSDLGGPLIANNSVLSEVACKLTELIRRAFIRGRVVSSIFKLTDRNLCALLYNTGSKVFDGSGYFLWDLESTPPQYIWEHIFNSRHSQRTYIRRFEKNDFSVRIASSAEDFEAFYSLYSQTVQRKRGRPYSHRFLYNLWQGQSPVILRILVVEMRGTIVASVGFLCYAPKKTLHIMYVGYRNIDSHYKLGLYSYWQTLVWAYSNGFTKVNSGTTPLDPANSLHWFKKQFGGNFQKRYVLRVPSNALVYSILTRLYQSTILRALRSPDKLG